MGLKHFNHLLLSTLLTFTICSSAFGNEACEGVFKRPSDQIITPLIKVEKGNQDRYLKKIQSELESITSKTENLYRNAPKDFEILAEISGGSGLMNKGVYRVRTSTGKVFVLKIADLERKNPDITIPTRTQFYMRRTNIFTSMMLQNILADF